MNNREANCFRNAGQVWEVTPGDANHSPGAVQLTFRLPGGDVQTELHGCRRADDAGRRDIHRQNSFSEQLQVWWRRWWTRTTALARRSSSSCCQPAMSPACIAWACRHGGVAGGRTLVACNSVILNVDRCGGDTGACEPLPRSSTAHLPAAWRRSVPALRRHALRIGAAAERAPSGRSRRPRRVPGEALKPAVQVLICWWCSRPSMCTAASCCASALQRNPHLKRAGGARATFLVRSGSP